LKEIATEITELLLHLFNLSLSTGVVPNSLKISRGIPVFKKGDRCVFRNYWPIYPYLKMPVLRCMDFGHCHDGRTAYTRRQLFCLRHSPPASKSKSKTYVTNMAMLKLMWSTSTFKRHMIENISVQLSIHLSLTVECAIGLNCKRRTTNAFVTVTVNISDKIVEKYVHSFTLLSKSSAHALNENAIPLLLL